MYIRLIFIIKTIQQKKIYRMCPVSVTIPGTKNIEKFEFTKIEKHYTCCQYCFNYCILLLLLLLKVVSIKRLGESDRDPFSLKSQATQNRHIGSFGPFHVKWSDFRKVPHFTIKVNWQVVMQKKKCSDLLKIYYYV